MTENKAKLAFDAIKSSFNTEQGEHGIDLFISHHIEELSEQTWSGLLGKAQPTASEVLEIMVLRSSWNDDLTYDFTLPNNVTNYVVSVLFNENGKIDCISMES